MLYLVIADPIRWLDNAEIDAPKDMSLLWLDFHKAPAMWFHLEEQIDIEEQAQEIIGAGIEKENTTILFEIEEGRCKMGLFHIEVLENGAKKIKS